MNASYLKNIKLADPPISVLYLSGASIKSTHTADFNFDDFPPHQRARLWVALIHCTALQFWLSCHFPLKCCTNNLQ